MTIKSKFLAGAFFTIAAFTSSNALAQTAGVCDREFDSVQKTVISDHARWVHEINNAGFPPAIRNSYINILNHTRDAGIAAANGKRVECSKKYALPQEIINIGLATYTYGLSMLLPGKSGYIDASELLNGYPLGGPEALIPKAREQLLGGDRGTVANIIRDPFKCITFARKC